MPGRLCHCVSVDQGGALPVFSATAELDGDQLHVLVTGEVDMATADTMLQTALREPAGHVTLDLRAVTFFDSAAIHALVRLAQRCPGALHRAAVPAGPPGAGDLRPRRAGLAPAGLTAAPTG